MKLIRRLYIAIRFFVFGFTLSSKLSVNIMEGYGKFLEFVCMVYKEKKPYMVDMAFSVDGDEEPRIVKIWAAIGEGADPLNRIDELITEINKLKGLTNETTD